MISKKIFKLPFPFSDLSAVKARPGFDTLEKEKDYKIIGHLKNTDKIMKDSFWVGVYLGIAGEMLE